MGGGASGTKARGGKMSESILLLLIIAGGFWIGAVVCRMFYDEGVKDGARAQRAKWATECGND